MERNPITFFYLSIYHLSHTHPQSPKATSHPSRPPTSPINRNKLPSNIPRQRTRKPTYRTGDLLRRPDPLHMRIVKQLRKHRLEGFRIDAVLRLDRAGGNDVHSDAYRTKRVTISQRL